MTKFLLRGALLSGLLWLGTAAAQVEPETALPVAPSVAKRVEVSTSVFPLALPEDDPPQAPAQVPPAENPDRGMWSLIKRGGRDQKEIYSAPFHRQNLKWDALFLVVTAGFIAGDRHITGAISNSDLSTSRRISDVGLYSTLATTGLLFAAGTVKKNEHARETGFLAFEAFANTLALSAVTQLIAGRERPLEGAGHGRFWVNNTWGSSFPSMHSSLTWPLASVLAHEYPQPWVQFLAYGTATTVSVTRVTGLEHFPADVVVGGLFGYFIGQHIFHAHSRFFHAHHDKPIPAPPPAS